MKILSDISQLLKAWFKDAKTGDKDSHCGGLQVGNREEERRSRGQAFACVLLPLWPHGNHSGQVTPTILAFPVVSS